MTHTIQKIADEMNITASAAQNRGGAVSWKMVRGWATDISALAAQGGEPVAWTVVGPDGESSIGGWHLMQSHAYMQRAGVLREGHRYAYAYEGKPPVPVERGEDDDECEPTRLQIEYARGYGDGVRHAEEIAAGKPQPAAHVDYVAALCCALTDHPLGPLSIAHSAVSDALKQVGTEGARVTDAPPIPAWLVDACPSRAWAAAWEMSAKHHAALNHAEKGEGNGR